MLPELNAVLMQFAGNDPDALMAWWVFHPKQLVGEKLAEALMNLADRIRCRGASSDIALVDPALHRNMGFSLKLGVRHG